MIDNQIHYTKMTSPIGDIYLFALGGQLVEVSFHTEFTGKISRRLLKVLGGSGSLVREDESGEDNNSEGESGRDNSILKNACRQINEYFEGRRKTFTLPYQTFGTPFEISVWNEIAKIPYGSTISYSCLADAAGSPKGARAAGGSCGKNPLPIIIPCHRVIGSQGSLTGFSGGLEIKKFLLKMEGVNIGK